MNLMDTIFVRELHDAGVALTETDIVAFEQEIGAALPAEYRQFLLFKNGGHFYAPIGFPLPDETYSDTLGLSIVFRLLEPVDENRNDLRRILKIHEGRIPLNTLPIADDADNLLLIDLDPKSGGALYLWRRDDEMTKEREDNKIFAEASFASMAANCRILQDYFSRLETLPPFVAVEHFDLNELKRLLDAGLDVNLTNEYGVSLLVKACDDLNYEAAVLLLARGADPNGFDRRGNSPLKSAAGQGALDLMKLLMKYRAHRFLPNDPKTRIVDALYPPPRRRVRALLLDAS